MIHESYLNKPKIIIHITKIKRYKTCINVLITYSRAEPSICSYYIFQSRAIYSVLLCSRGNAGTVALIGIYT